MNKLPIKSRATILNMLVEGTSMRSISRMTGVSINTVTKLLVDAGTACAAYHDETVRGVAAKRVQCDEIWSFTYAKQKNVAGAKAAPEEAGDTWTWTALDADSKLIISYLVGGRDAGEAYEFMSDVADRLANRVQLTTDGHHAYLDAVEEVFGADVDYAQLVKLYGAAPEGAKGRYSPAECTGIRKRRVEGRPDEAHVSTSYVERQNLSMRMHMRRFTRLTNGFSKKVANHTHMVSLYTVWYNFCRIHKTLRVTPAMEAGISDTLRDCEWIVGLIDAAAPARKRGVYKKKSQAGA
ncbi:DDE-type integrase/transposase/recombinase [Acuticoccus mangrovi]|uniref:DDE-type integrase/transposase/recombinase n=1 Tax=Acuticoccus mangrovi TaxID=2796142 RepID=A0A934MHD7_9HYPH|nr:DDE-type integrase/transposase/recombinase [Acuticoccus mangrovi]MBJ3777553.1 DDE-type integrase/transposase/recombinase [Acuticoccus mangrovi]